MNHNEMIGDHTAGAGSESARDANALLEFSDPGPANLSEEGVLLGAEGASALRTLILRGLSLATNSLRCRRTDPRWRRLPAANLFQDFRGLNPKSLDT